MMLRLLTSAAIWAAHVSHGAPAKGLYGIATDDQYYIGMVLTNTSQQLTYLVGLDLSSGKEVSRALLPFQQQEFVGQGQMMAAGLPDGQVIVGGQPAIPGPYVVGKIHPAGGNFTKVASFPGSLVADFDVVSAYAPSTDIYALQLGDGTAAAWYWVNMTSGKTGSWADCDVMQTINYDPKRGAFIGVGLLGDQNRTVVSMDASTGECTLLGQLPGYYILDGGEAAFDGSAGTLWTFLQPTPGGSTVPYHQIAVDTTQSPVQVISSKPQKADVWQLEFYHGQA